MTPILRIISRPEIDWQAINDFLGEETTEWNRSEDASPAEEIVEFAGRVCYLSFGPRQSPRKNCDYLKNLVDKGHESVLEHATWTFELSQVSRSFTHQLVRHRVGFSFSQMSQQYVDQTNVQIVPPMDFSRYPRAALAWERAENAVRDAYKELKNALQEDLPQDLFSSLKERSRFVNTISRQILPNATSTTIVFSANARSLRHFLAIRGCIEGDPEMRKVSALLLVALNREAPALFSDFHLGELKDGSPIVILKKDENGG